MEETHHVRAPVAVRRSPIHGRGLFAAGRITRGALIGVYEGRRTRRNGAYTLWVIEDDGTEWGVSGSTKLRFMNHSPRPNARFHGLEVRAVRNIRPGEEITADYGPYWRD